MVKYILQSLTAGENLHVLHGSLEEKIPSPGAIQPDPQTSDADPETVHAGGITQRNIRFETRTERSESTVTSCATGGDDLHSSILALTHILAALNPPHHLSSKSFCCPPAHLTQNWALATPPSFPTFPCLCPLSPTGTAPSTGALTLTRMPWTPLSPSPSSLFPRPSTCGSSQRHRRLHARATAHPQPSWG